MAAAVSWATGTLGGKEVYLCLFFRLTCVFLVCLTCVFLLLAKQQSRTKALLTHTETPMKEGP